MMENNWQPQGYTYEFVPPLNHKFECPICLLCRKDAMRTYCGHTFCQECILAWLRTKKKCCPTDGFDLTEQDIFPDIHERQEILSLKVRCPEAKNGCSVIMELGQIQNHESSCGHAMIFCPAGCHTEIYRKDTETHMAHCKNRRAQFACFGEEFSVIEQKVLCEYCNVFVSMKDKEQHVQLDCQRVPISCQFADWGCPYSQVERQHLLKHQEKCVTIHVDLLEKALTKITKACLQQPKINNTVEIESSEAVGCSSSGKHKNQTEASWGILQPDYREVCKALYQNNIQLQKENQGLLNAVKLLQKKIVSLEEKMCQGVYYWRIQNFSSHEDEVERTGCRELKSTGFYTGPHGYRVSLRTTLKSKENRKYNLSLFIHLMQGDNDDFLSWPFSGSIELCILDKQVNEEFKRPILKTMGSDPQCDAFQRPTKDCNLKGFGYKEFANSELLHDPKRKYLKNDTLTIRAEVVPTMFF